MNPAAPDNFVQPSRGFFLKRFTVILLLSLLVAGAGMLVLYALESKAVQVKIQTESRNLVSLQKKYIEGVTEQVKSDLMYLAAMVEQTGIPVSPTDPEAKSLSRTFSLFMKEKPIYDQIRFIDLSGIEILRINQSLNGPESVPPERLQDKSNRYYVQAAFGVPPGNVYISRLDLNIENESVEQPPKPVVRFATPVHSLSGAVHGIVILNLLGNTLFQEMHATEIRHNVHDIISMNTLLFDSQGYWLYNPLDPAKQYGFMFPNMKDITISVTSPEAWAALSRSEDGMYLGYDGLYVFNTIDIISEYGQKETSFDTGHPWKIVVFTSTPSLATAYGALQKKFIIPFAGLALLLTVISWLLAGAQTKTRLAEARIAHLAHHDHLTGLANRLLFQNLASLAISTAERNKQQFALLFMDLDRFKPLNDTLGHKAGDEALTEISRRIQHSVRRPDIVARLGGDEFAIILQDVDGPKGALKVAYKIIGAVSNPLTIQSIQTDVGASIGVSIYPSDGTDLDTLLRKADDAMYRAKELGGGRSMLFSDCSGCKTSL